MNRGLLWTTLIVLVLALCFDVVTSAKNVDVKALELLNNGLEVGNKAALQYFISRLPQEPASPKFVESVKRMKRSEKKQMKEYLGYVAEEFVDNIVGNHPDKRDAEKTEYLRNLLMGVARAAIHNVVETPLEQLQADPEAYSVDNTKSQLPSSEQPIEAAAEVEQQDVPQEQPGQTSESNEDAEQQENAEQEQVEDSQQPDEQEQNDQTQVEDEQQQNPKLMSPADKKKLKKILFRAAKKSIRNQIRDGTFTGDEDDVLDRTRNAINTAVENSKNLRSSDVQLEEAEQPEQKQEQTEQQEEQPEQDEQQPGQSEGQQQEEQDQPEQQESQQESNQSSQQVPPLTKAQQKLNEKMNMVFALLRRVIKLVDSIVSANKGAESLSDVWVLPFKTFKKIDMRSKLRVLDSLYERANRIRIQNQQTRRVMRFLMDIIGRRMGNIRKKVYLIVVHKK